MTGRFIFVDIYGSSLFIFFIVSYYSIILQYMYSPVQSLMEVRWDTSCRGIDQHGESEPEYCKEGARAEGSRCRASEPELSEEGIHVEEGNDGGCQNLHVVRRKCAQGRAAAAVEISCVCWVHQIIC